MAKFLVGYAFSVNELATEEYLVVAAFSTREWVMAEVLVMNWMSCDAMAMATEVEARPLE